MTLASEKLTNNQQTVLDLLEKSKEPLKAYAILFDIQKKELKHLFKSTELWINL